MSKNIYTIAEIQDKITHIPEHFKTVPEAIVVTQNGKPIMAILPWQLYESLIETLEVMGDAELMAAFRQGVQELQEGKGRDWEDVKKELELK